MLGAVDGIPVGTLVSVGQRRELGIVVGHEPGVGFRMFAFTTGATVIGDPYWTRVVAPPDDVVAVLAALDQRGGA
jgi:hypothetical protein